MTVALTVNIRGGGGLADQIGHSRQAQAAFVNNFQVLYQKRVLPVMERHTARRSGQLAKSYELRRTGLNSVALLSSGRPARYVNHVYFTRQNQQRALGTRTVQGLVKEVFRREGQGALLAAARAAGRGERYR